MKKGFTLIEILIAVAIIAILTAIGIVSYASINKRARDAKRLGDIEQIRSALEMYRADYYKYPAVNTSAYDTAANLKTILAVDNTYLPSVPDDPQATHAYYYTATNYDEPSDSYYGYCICGYIESQAAVSTTTGCSTYDPAGDGLTCNYYVRQP